jgi:hypothetical protein
VGQSQEWAISAALGLIILAGAGFSERGTHLQPEDNKKAL